MRRMCTDRLPQRIWKPNTRKRARSRRSWNDEIKEFFRTRGLNEANMRTDLHRKRDAVDGKFILNVYFKKIKTLANDSHRNNAPLAVRNW